MRRETQLDLLFNLRRLALHVASAAASLEPTRALDGEKVLCLAAIAAVADAVVRALACDNPSALSVFYAGRADESKRFLGSGEPFGFDVRRFAAETGRAVNIKKGQFLAPWDMKHATEKCAAAGNANLLVTERGSSFGYGRLVVDMTAFETLTETGHPVVFDATHSVQRPGGADGRTGGDRRLVPALARAAVATGHVDGLFFEVHPDPDTAPSDGPNMVRLDEFGGLLDGVLAVLRAVT